MTKKILPLFLAIIIFFSSTVMQVQKAHAFAWAVAPAGATLGAGAFLAGALVVGSVATGLGLEYGDEIKQAGKDVWNTTTDAVKDSMNASIEAAQTAGSKVVNFSQDVTDWFSSKAKQMAGIGASFLVKKAVESLPQNTYDGTQIPTNTTGVEESYTVSTKFELPYLYTYESTYYNLKYSYNYSDLGYSPTTTWMATTENGVRLYQQIDITVAPDGLIRNLQLSYPITQMQTDEEGNSISSLQLISRFDGIYLSNFGLTYQEFLSIGEKAFTAEKVTALLVQLGITNVVPAPIDQALNAYNNSRNKLLQQDIPNMKDAGLVIPTQDIVAHPVAQPDINLTYNPANDTYTYPDGTVYTGDIDISFPVPYVGEGGELLVQSGDGSITNVNTGEVVSPPTTTNPPTTGDTPKSIDWTKLKVAIGTLTTVFPFSIPWDVFRLLSVLNVPPETPVFNINVNKSVTIFGTSIPIKYDFDIDFSAFDPLAAVGRWGLILVFDISIIMALRRLTPD